MNTKDNDLVIPNLDGMPAMDAIVVLEQMGLKFQLDGEGKVFSQSIKSGSKIDYNKSTVKKTLEENTTLSNLA